MPCPSPTMQLTEPILLTTKFRGHCTCQPAWLKHLFMYTLTLQFLMTQRCQCIPCKVYQAAPVIVDQGNGTVVCCSAHTQGSSDRTIDRCCNAKLCIQPSPHSRREDHKVGFPVQQTPPALKTVLKRDAPHSNPPAQAQPLPVIPKSPPSCVK